MVEIPENWKSVLDFLVEAPVAWQSIAQIARALVWGVEETTDLLSDMDVAGWISVWVLEPEPLITLSTLAAYHYQVVLVELGPEEFPRWSLAGEPDPIPPRAKNVASCEYHARQDKLLDPGPAPDLAMEQAEIQARRAARYRRHLAETCCEADDLPLPCHLLGQSLTPWPGPPRADGSALCPVCAGRPLLPHVYCLYCNRWGLDDVLDKLVAQAERASRQARSSSQQSTPNESASARARTSPEAPAEAGSGQRTANPESSDRVRRKETRRQWRAARTVKW
jgi:hypothetical protein